MPRDGICQGFRFGGLWVLYPAPENGFLISVQRRSTRNPRLKLCEHRGVKGTVEGWVGRRVCGLSVGGRPCALGIIWFRVRGCGARLRP